MMQWQAKRTTLRLARVQRQGLQQKQRFSLRTSRHQIFPHFFCGARIGAGYATGEETLMLAKFCEFSSVK